MSVSQIRSSSITVSWSGVPCAKRNGEITGYVLEYSSRLEKKKMNLSRELRSTVITRLDHITEYSVRVASANSEGIGPFSEIVYTNTSEYEKIHSYTCFGYQLTVTVTV